MVSPFTFYRGRGARHGHRPGLDPDDGAARAAVRRRAPVQLRRVRLSRASAGVRHQRLRRDRCPGRWSGTSSAWPRASRSPGATAALPAPGARHRCPVGRRGVPHGDGAVRRARPTSRCGTRSLDIDDDPREVPAAGDQGDAGPHRTRRSPGPGPATACTALAKLTEWSTGQPRIKNDPPLVIRAEAFMTPRMAPAA